MDTGTAQAALIVSIVAASISLVSSGVAVVSLVRTSRRDPKPVIKYRLHFFDSGESDRNPALTLHLRNEGSETAKDLKIVLHSPGRAPETYPERAVLDPDSREHWDVSLANGDFGGKYLGDRFWASEGRPVSGRWKIVARWRHFPNGRRGKRAIRFKVPGQSSTGSAWL